MEKTKLALGTAQFGMEYGINNHRGKVNISEVKAIIDYCEKHGIEKFDTAYLYGESENVLGKALQGKQFPKIITKLPSVVEDGNVESYLNTSLSRLGTSHLYGYLLHSFATYQNSPEVFDQVIQFKERGLIKKVGFSVYYPQELEKALESNIPFDLVQLPINILDQRFKYLLPELKAKKVEVHGRSVFLQGLLLMTPDQLPDYFSPVKDRLVSIHTLASELSIPVNILLLCFVHSIKEVDNLVVGVDSLDNLKENFSYLEYLLKLSDLNLDFDLYKFDDEHIILPFKWKV